LTDKVGSPHGNQGGGEPRKIILQVLGKKSGPVPGPKI